MNNNNSGESPNEQTPGVKTPTIKNQNENDNQSILHSYLIDTTPVIEKSKIDQKDEFIKMINTAKTPSDYKNQSKEDQKSYSQKKAAINKLKTMLKDQNSVDALFIPNLGLVIEMINQNIFRTLSRSNNIRIEMTYEDIGYEMNDIVYERLSVHIKFIYELFQQLISNDSCTVGVLKIYVTKNFINEFLQLFDSDSYEERDYLKTILHKIYSKLICKRKMIRNALCNIFYVIINELTIFNGTLELLEILASIISGFTLPLRGEHVIFFKRILIPLHKVQTFSLFFDNFIRCAVLYLQKDPTLSIPLLEGILKYWPVANNTKETLFISELTEVLPMCNLDDLKPLLPRLLRKVIRIISEGHFQCAVKAIGLFDNEIFLTIIKKYKSISFTMLVPVIANLSATHWSQGFKFSLVHMRDMLKIIDPQTYDNALENEEMKLNDKTTRISQPQKERMKLDNKWKLLIAEAKTMNEMINEPVIPYSDNVLLSDCNEVYKKISLREKYLWN